MSFSVGDAVRRRRPQRLRGPLRRRDDTALAFASPREPVGAELLFDTTVYVDTARGRFPNDLERMLRMRIINHSAVALGELTWLFGRLDPTDPRTADALRVLRGPIEAIPAHRLTAPTVRAHGEAGMLAGLAARLVGRARDQALVNDALLLLHALERGLALLTANIADFDILQQLAPEAQVLFYRRV